jgi:diguanylate cyclase
MVVGLLLPILLRLLNFQFFTDLAEVVSKRLTSLASSVGRILRNQEDYREAKVTAALQVDPREQQLNDSAQEIRTILHSLASLLQRTGQAASHSSSTLGDVRTTIDDIQLPQDLGKVHALLIQEIDRMISNNTTLKEELTRSQDSLETQRKQIENLKTAIRVDGLTQLPNRVYFDEKLMEMVSLQNRYPDPFSLLMIDVDNFKQINDSLGHQAGDRFLRRIAVKLKASIRESDFIARFGGDEFALILPKTKAVAASELGRKICNLMEESRFLLDGKEFTMTLSIGITEVVLGDTPETLINRADGALYQAKQEGRNRAIIAAPPPENPAGLVSTTRRK